MLERLGFVLPANLLFMFSVKGKHIIVTGASGVIGSTIAIGLAKAGGHFGTFGQKWGKNKKYLGTGK